MLTEEGREKRKRLRGRPLRVSEDGRRRQREAAARRWTPEARAEHAEIMRERNLGNSYGTGQIWTEERRQKARERSQEGWLSGKWKKQDPEKMAENTAKALAEGRMPNRATSIEKILWKLLENADFEVLRNHRMGRAVCDAYLPQEHLAFEADGWYWHGGRDPEDKIKDAIRDARLTERFNLPVVRLTEEELLDIGKQLASWV